MSTVSMAQSNGIAGPRGGRSSLAPPLTPHGPRPSANTYGAWQGSTQSNFPKAPWSNTSATRPSTVQHPSKGIGDSDGLASQFAGMSVSGAQPKLPTYDPSNGPSPSMLTVASRPFSTAPSHRSARSTMWGQGAVKTDLCILTRATRQTYSRGDIISVPVHKINRNPNIDLADTNLTKTRYGGVYSKRRMVVIMWINYESMFCLPLHTYSKNGLSKKPNQMRGEFVCVKNEQDVDFNNQGVHVPVEAVCKRPLDANTVIPLGDHVEVGYRDDIAPVGEMTRDGFIRLLALWEQVATQAKKEPRKQRTRGYGGSYGRGGMPAIMESA